MKAIDLSKLQPILHPIPSGGLASPYLPIEYFRDHDLIHKLFCGQDIGCRFLSSGTTATARSHSFFSREGLKSYRRSSVATFLEALKLRSPRRNLPMNPAMIGVSLVPPAAEWPDSSLAQMVSWIGEAVPLIYSKPEELHQTLSGLAKSHPGAPCWVFGTAFHFVQIEDARLPRTPLPQGSIIFETGGTKGKSRAVTQKELQEILMNRFQVPRTHIISEYGMSELACQAYSEDTVEALESSIQWFRFPPWVKLSVMVKPGTSAPSGRGLLIVYDPQRQDFPWPIRTEDFVELRPSGQFRLLGRAVFAPLKGCSLQVEQALFPFGANGSPEKSSPEKSSPEKSSPEKSSIERCNAPPQPQTLGQQTRPPLQGAPGLLERIHALAAFPGACRRSACQSALSLEFESEAAASICWEDLFRDFPTFENLNHTETSSETITRWTRVAHRALGLDSNSPDWFNSINTRPTQHWLFLLPENHSVVGVYPLLLAYLCGHRVTLRMPKAFASEESFLSLFLEECHKHLPGFQLTCLPPTFRLEAPPENTDIGAHTLATHGQIVCKSGLTFDRILVYGADETILALETWFPGSVQSFGHSWALSVVLKSELLATTEDHHPAKSWDADMRANLLRDFLSLAQSGCRSSRLLLVLEDEADLPQNLTQSEKKSPLEIISAYLNKVPRDSLAGSLRVAGRRDHTPRAYGLEFESCRLTKLGFQVFEDGLLFAQKHLSNGSLPPGELVDFESLGSKMSGTIPIFIIPRTTPKDLLLIGNSLFAQPHLAQICMSHGAQKLLNPLFLDRFHTSGQKPRFERLGLGEGNNQVWDGLHQGKPLWIGSSKQTHDTLA